MMLWRITQGIIDWGPREVELLYESTLDSISEAFDVFHYPVSRYMLDARADVWEGGLAPGCVKDVVEASASALIDQAPNVPKGSALVLAGEIAQVGDDAFLTSLDSALQAAGVDAVDWVVPTGALAYALGAWDVAETQAERVVAGIRESGAQTIIADGPETAWALTKIYPALGVDLPDAVTVKLLSEVLDNHLTPPEREMGMIFVHDSRPALMMADAAPSHLAILPGYIEDESEFGKGVVYEAPRRLLDAMIGQRIYGAWTRGLAKTSGADDGLWLTYPDLAAGLAAQRLEYAKSLGATMLVTDSPLAASYLSRNAQPDDVPVRWLPEVVTL